MAKPTRPTSDFHRPVTVLRRFHSSPDGVSSNRGVVVDAPEDRVDDLLWLFIRLRNRLDGYSYPNGVPDADFWASLPEAAADRHDQLTRFANDPFEANPPQSWLGNKIDPAYLGTEWTGFFTFLQRLGIKCLPLPGLTRGGDTFDPKIYDSEVMGVFDVLEAGAVTFRDVDHTPFGEKIVAEAA